MSITKRIYVHYATKLAHLFDQISDPREQVEYADAQLLELLARVRQSAASVTASRRYAESRLRELNHAYDLLQGQADRLFADDKEELATQAGIRLAELKAEVAGLSAQLEMLGIEERQLTAAEMRIRVELADFRIWRESVKAGNPAAGLPEQIARVLAAVNQEETPGLVISRSMS